MKATKLWLIALALAGCEVIATTPVKDDTPAEPATPAPPADGKLDMMMDVPIVQPPPEKQPQIRKRRRMDVDQLDQAIFDTTGERWTSDASGVEVNRFVALARPLGTPDDLPNPHEELTPTVMFQRFLDDASRAVCTKLIDLEVIRSEEDRVFMVHADADDRLATAEADIRRNLQMLLLRFHGVLVATDAERLEPWVRLYGGVESDTGEAVNAWRAVCTTLIAHPDFYTY